MKTNKIQGITIISLVVTIIILLILSGVTISSITGQNGILERTKLAKEMSKASNEKEAIELDIALVNMERIFNNSGKYYTGIPLYDKNLENGNKWNIIVENETQKAYGTGWNYLIKGTEIENYGKIQYNWLVNYESGELKQLEENTYTQLMYGSNLAVKDELVLNVDPINMSDSTSWGENIKLYGVENNDGYGYNGDEIKLDGINDYIEIYTGDNKINEGITFEYYGNLKGKTAYILNKTIKKPKEGWERFSRKFRSALVAGESASFSLSMNGIDDSDSSWSLEKPQSHWIRKKFDINYINNTDGYITVTINIVDNTVTLYWNGDYVDRTTVNHDWMVNTEGGFLDSEIPFTIGLQAGGSSYTENYSEMNIYACRLYTKILTDEEIKDNYIKTVTYHNMANN